MTLAGVDEPLPPDRGRAPIGRDLRTSFTGKTAQALGQARTRRPRDRGGPCSQVRCCTRRDTARPDYGWLSGRSARCARSGWWQARISLSLIPMEARAALSKGPTHVPFTCPILAEREDHGSVVFLPMLGPLIRRLGGLGDAERPTIAVSDSATCPRRPCCKTKPVDGNAALAPRATPALNRAPPSLAGLSAWGWLGQGRFVMAWSPLRKKLGNGDIAAGRADAPKSRRAMH